MLDGQFAGAARSTRPTFARDPSRIITSDSVAIPSFVSEHESNLDPAIVSAFGREWQRFNEFGIDEIEQGGREYFGDLLPDALLCDARVLDVGCGSGRWTRYLAARAAFVEAAEPSDAVVVAARSTRGCPNVRVIHAGVSSLPYRPESFDVVASVGVLHHVPDTFAAIEQLARFVRPGGQLFLYLYYRLEGRPRAYRAAFQTSRALRAIVSRLPGPLKVVAADAAAVGIYLPLVTLGRLLRALRPHGGLHEHVPLYYYIDKPWKILRNDALDRLGTPLERRFSRAEIVEMLSKAGFTGIRFGDAMPRWRVVATK